MGDSTKGVLGMVGGQAASAALGLTLGYFNDRRQRAQQEKLTAIQEEAQNRLADKQAQRNLEYWKLTGPVAQKEQLKAAGLNPALMYGMGGGTGGQSMGGSPSAGGANAPAGGREIQDSIGMGMQLQLLKAQKENIEADTALKQSDAANNPLKGKNIEADTVNKSLQKLILEYQGKEAQSQYEEVDQPNRAMAARAKTDRLSAESAEGQTTNQLFMEGEKLKGELAKIKGLELTNEKTMAEIAAIAKRLDNETKLANNKITDDAYYRMIHDVSDSLDLTVKSAADVLRIVASLIIGKSIKRVQKIE